MPWQLLVVVCGINALLCLVGVISNKFHDNIFQRLGLALICMTSLARVQALWVTEHDMNLLRSWIHFGIFFFAFGTWYRIVAHTWLVEHPQYWSWAHFPPKRRKEDTNGEEHIAG